MTIQLNDANLQVFSKVVNLEIQKAVQSVNSAFSKGTYLAFQEAFYMLNSNQRVEFYDYATLLGQFRDFEGNTIFEKNSVVRLIVADKIRALGQYITKADFQDGMAEDFKSKISAIPQFHQQDINKRVVELLNNAENDDSKGFDELPFFTADNSTNRANLITGTGTTDQQMKNDVLNAWQKMVELEIKDGVRISLEPNLIIARPHIAARLRKLFGSSGDVSAAHDGIQNELTTAFNSTPKIVGVSDLENDNDIYLFHTKSPFIKPFLFQNRQSLEITRSSDKNDMGMFDVATKDFKISADYRAAFAFLCPYGAVKISNT